MTTLARQKPRKRTRTRRPRFRMSYRPRFVIGLAVALYLFFIGPWLMSPWSPWNNPALTRTVLTVEIALFVIFGVIGLVASRKN